MDASPQPRLPRIRRKWPWVAGIFLFLPVLAAGAYSILYWLGTGDLDKVIAELDRTDPGWRLEEIEANRKAIPAEQNSALQCIAVKAAFGGRQLSTRALHELFADLPPHPQLNKQQAEYLEKHLAKFQKAVVLARALKDMPEGRFPITYAADGISTSLKHVQDAREVVHLLLCDANRRAHALDADGALESCLAILNAACAIGDEPIMMSQLVRYAGGNVTVEGVERTLAQGQPSDVSLSRMQGGIEREIRELLFLTVVRGERAEINRFMEAVAEGKASKQVLMSGLGDVASQFFPGFIESKHAAALRLLTERIEIVKADDTKLDDEHLLAEKSLGPAFALLFSAVAKIADVHRRTQANLRCAAAALAAERFRLAHRRWPLKLEELVEAKLLDAVPIDPYNGKPLRLKKTTDGVIVYSVGKDRQDNGGNIDRNRAASEPGTDLGFQLWDVASRRGPPLPAVQLEDRELDK